MIALRNAKLTDALPKIIAKEPWAQAMAYAVNQRLKKLVDYANGTLVSANVGEMPDAVLDILAIELRLPYYKKTYSTSIKRELIKGALAYWATAGTPGSLTEILEDIFGDAEVLEWFEYSGTPGYFKIITTNPNVTGETLQEFQRIAGDVKRLSAWLQEVTVDMGIPNMELNEGNALYIHTETELTQST